MYLLLNMYLKDDAFFRTIWTNLKAKFTNNKIDSGFLAAVRKERQVSSEKSLNILLNEGCPRSTSPSLLNHRGFMYT